MHLEVLLLFEWSLSLESPSEEKKNNRILILIPTITLCWDISGVFNNLE